MHYVDVVQRFQPPDDLDDDFPDFVLSEEYLLLLMHQDLLV